MKTISKEEVESYIGSLQAGSFEGWTPGEINGYNTACASIKSYLQQLHPTPQSEVMTLEECRRKIYPNSVWRNLDSNVKRLYMENIAIVFAQQYIDKSDQLQSELEQVKAERDVMYKALKTIRFFPFNSAIHPSTQGEKAIEIATEALQTTKQ